MILFWDNILNMSDIIELDDRDWAILKLVQSDATLSLQAIADAVGLSTNPCWRRVKRMEEAGVIARRVALLDPGKVGAGTCVFKVRTGDIGGYDRIYQKLIRRVPDLADVTASFSMEELKATTALPRPD